MKRFGYTLFGFVVGFLFAAAVPVAAQQLPTPKIAVVDVQLLMGKSKAAESIRTQIESYRASYQEQLTQKENNLRTAEQNLIQQRNVLSPEAFTERQKDFQRQVADVQREVQTLKRNLDQALASSMQQVEKAIVQVANELAAQIGADMIITKNMVIYTVPQAEITQQVLTRLNQILPSVNVAIP